MRKQLSIERLLHWAYRDELPKQAVGGLTGWEATIYLGTRVDTSPMPDAYYPAVMGAPHPDALAIDWWVRQLEPVTVDWPAVQRELLFDLRGIANAYNPLSDLARRTFDRSALVQLHARMGTRPDWDTGLDVAPVMAANNRPLVRWIDQRGRTVSGSKRGGWYSAGAVCMLKYSPALSEIAHARLEWIVWRGALQTLCETLNSTGRLAEHVALPTSAPLAPWITDSAKPRILQALPRT